MQPFTEDQRFLGWCVFCGILELVPAIYLMLFSTYKHLYVNYNYQFFEKMQGIIDSCCQHHAILIDWLILFYFSAILAVSGPEADCRYLPKYYGGPHDTPLDNPYCSYSHFFALLLLLFRRSRRRVICAPRKTGKRWIFL